VRLLQIYFQLAFCKLKLLDLFKEFAFIGGVRPLAISRCHIIKVRLASARPFVLANTDLLQIPQESERLESRTVHHAGLTNYTSR
jgi:hypothetical protein